MRELCINKRRMSDDSDCYVIAELGQNHQGSLKMALEMIKVAKDCGADAVKLQKRHNKSLYARALYDQPYENENSFGSTYGKHREALEFGLAEYKELQKCADDCGVDLFATAWDFKSADFLHDLRVPAFKIASGDMKSMPLLKYIAAFKKPMIISTGGCSLDDVRRVYDALMPINKKLCFLQCTAAYPASAEILNLNVITTYRREFPYALIGLSDHENGIAMAVAAYVLGARVIEKHFTLNHTLKGTDHAFSLEPIGMRKLVRDLKRVKQALGDGVKRPLACEEKPIIKMSKKMVAARPLKKGKVLSFRDVAFKSPGDGMFPCELESVLGRKLVKHMDADEAFSPQSVSKKPVR
ncbi:MAG: N-acetylneuraminate synthase [Lentisphaerae bacterium RIFOXYA12_FULL_48_11]|nr:MAG: N-acetylneuraminate synthase [Lentisphaerae bacterium RIFOXYA12_FULL_48_11]